MLIAPCRLHRGLRGHRVQEDCLASGSSTGTAVIRANWDGAVDAMAAIVRRALCVFILQDRHSVLDRRSGRARWRGREQRRWDSDAVSAGWLVSKRVLERRWLLVPTVLLVHRRGGVPGVAVVIMRRRPALLRRRVIVVLRPALIRVALLLVSMLLVSLLLITTMLLVASLVPSLLSSVLILVLTAVIVIPLTLSLASALTLVVLVKTILLVLVIPIASTVRLVPIGVVLGLVIAPTTLVLLLVFHVLEDIGDVESALVEAGRAARHEIKLC